jgi:hypothetical protein
MQVSVIFGGLAYIQVRVTGQLYALKPALRISPNVVLHAEYDNK